MKGILGKKVGMTQVFTKSGKLIPVTVVEVPDNVVYQVKTIEKDGYNAVKLGVFNKKERNANKPEIGNAKIAKTEPKRFLKEIRNFKLEVAVGDVIKGDLFKEGEIVDVTGTSKGKGFQGVIKRHNFSIGPMSHGSRFHRKPGSLGNVQAKRVFKGTKLPGHMGNETVTVQNLEIIEINTAENYILISGNVPGPKGSYVLIKSAVKTDKVKEAVEILKYVEEIKEEPKQDKAEEEVKTKLNDEVSETEQKTDPIKEETQSEEK